MGSEYGLQSLPSYETLEPVYEDVDMDYWGDLSEWRQHHPFGKIEYRDMFCSFSSATILFKMQWQNVKMAFLRLSWQILPIGK